MLASKAESSSVYKIARRKVFSSYKENLIGSSVSLEEKTYQMWRLWELFKYMKLAKPYNLGNTHI